MKMVQGKDLCKFVSIKPSILCICITLTRHETDTRRFTELMSIYNLSSPYAQGQLSLEVKSKLITIKLVLFLLFTRDNMLRDINFLV